MIGKQMKIVDDGIMSMQGCGLVPFFMKPVQAKLLQITDRIRTQFKLKTELNLLMTYFFYLLGSEEDPS